MKTLSDFEREISCSSSLSCETDYNGCFKSCGGRIEQQTYCVSNCKLIEPPQPDGVPVGPRTTL